MEEEVVTEQEEVVKEVVVGVARGVDASSPLGAAVDSKGESRFAPDGLSQWQNENADFTGCSHVFLLPTQIKNGRSFVTGSPHGYGGGDGLGRGGETRGDETLLGDNAP